MKKIIGLLGRIGSGKGTVAKYLRDIRGYPVISLGDLVREETRKSGLTVSRKNAIMISKKRTKNNPYYWLDKAVKRIKKKEWDKVIIDGLRYPSDISYLKKEFPKMILISVTAKPELRYKRMKLRRRPGFPKTYEEFIEEEKAEEKNFRISKALNKADYKISNNSTKDELLENIKRLSIKNRL